MDLVEAERKIGSGKVLVIGDVMLDRYVWGEVRRISPEAPVQIVRVLDRSEVLGGAGNVAANLAGLKCPVFLVGIRGADSAGELLRGLLEKSGIQSGLVADPLRPTITKTRIMAQGQQLLRLDEEQIEVPSEGILELVSDMIQKIMPECGAVVLSDYGKGLLASGSFVQKTMGIARQHGIPVLVDPKGTDWERYQGAACITPNMSEFEAVGGSCAEKEDLFEKLAGEVLRRCDAEWLLVTRGSRGMSFFNGESAPLTIPATAREVYDVSGAGDTVIATLAAGVASGLSFPESAFLANMAAGIVVGKLGTQPIGRSELQSTARLSSPAANGPCISKICSLEAAGVQIKSWRASGNRIVFTNGCFDLLHPGHIQLLQQAKDLGERLIIGLNSDVSVRRLKGDARPILSERDRAALLASLACVDMVVIFEEDTPLRLIESLKPDILVKGADYRLEEVVGRGVVEQHGGKVVLVPIAQGFSTTGIVNKILG